METALSTSSPIASSDASSSGRRHLGHHARGRLAALLPPGSIKETKIFLEDEGNFLQGWNQHFLMDGQGFLGLFGRRRAEFSQIVALH